MCTGNICRSPAVERMLAARLGPSVTVASAGTHALVDQPIAPGMLELLQAREVDGSGFRARLLAEPLLRGADLILALTRAHRSLVVQMWPAAVRRTFTVREFARLLEGIDRTALPAGSPADRLRAALPLVTAQRGRVLVSANEDDVVDPYGGRAAVYQASFAQMLPAVETITAVAVAG
ncbi:MAG: low molecular weight phosphatase family protein [Actinomycetes bacterium]